MKDSVRNFREKSPSREGWEAIRVKCRAFLLPSHHQGADQELRSFPLTWLCKNYWMFVMMKRVDWAGMQADGTQKD
jgi:hypothetical protein